jgi:MFS family permease
MVDRRGPRALLVFAPVHGAALALVIAGCSGPDWAPVLAAALAGAAVPPVIATARAVWVGIAGPERVATAHALNAALGDAAQVLGPALTAAIAALLSPALALALLIPGVLTGALIVALGTSTQRPVTRTAHRVWGVLHESAGLRTLALCDALLGLAFGGLDVTVPALAQDAGLSGVAGVPLAAFAAGSISSTLWTGAARWRPAAARYLTGTFVVATTLPLCLAFPSLAGLTGVLIVAGAGFGLLNVALFQLLDEVATADRAVEALTWLTTAQGVGLAAGAALAGQLAHEGGLVLVAFPAVLAALVAWRRRAGLRMTPAQ